MKVNCMKFANFVPCLNRLFSVLIVVGFYLGMGGERISSSFAQETGVPAANPPSATTGTSVEGGQSQSLMPKTETLWDIIHGGGWIMLPLLAISIWCLALVIEGFYRIRLGKFAPPDIGRGLEAAFAEENYQRAWTICKSRSTFLTNILRYGLERIGRGRIACEAAISEHSLKESMIFRTKISYLSTIGVVSPMVGLLGTVTGMIKAFKALGQGGIADPSRLAGAIGEVLIATASGLAVAIPAFFLYYFLRNRLQTVIVLAEDVINKLMMDVKYEELQGIKIGEAMEAELAGAVSPSEETAGAAAPMTRTVESGKGISQPVNSMTLTCPQCSAPLRIGAPKCTHCGAELQWS